MKSSGGHDLVCESPSLVKDGRLVVRYEALDILLLEEPCAELAATMSLDAARSWVGVEAKAYPKQLDKMLDNIRACQAGLVPSAHPESEHKKCLAIAELRPRFFLGIASGETWRLFRVDERDARAVLGDELPDLDCLHFGSMSKRA